LWPILVGVSSHALDQLTLAPAVITGTLDDGNVIRHPESHCLDFVINGELLTETAANGGLGDLVTPLNRPWLTTVPSEIDQLLGHRPHPDLASGRIAVLVCAVCGDLGCGAVTAALTVRDDTVIWSEWALENGRDQADPIDALGPSAVFDRPLYEAALRGAYAQLAALPYDELAHLGRRFLWPWQWGWRIPRNPTH
jgi:hypothetical protein